MHYLFSSIQAFLYVHCFFVFLLKNFFCFVVHDFIDYVWLAVMDNSVCIQPRSIVGLVCYETCLIEKSVTMTRLFFCSSLDLRLENLSGFLPLFSLMNNIFLMFVILVQFILFCYFKSNFFA